MGPQTHMWGEVLRALSTPLKHPREHSNALNLVHMLLIVYIWYVRSGGWDGCGFMVLKALLLHGTPDPQEGGRVASTFHPSQAPKRTFQCLQPCNHDTHCISIVLKEWVVGWLWFHALEGLPSTWDPKPTRRGRCC